MAVVALDTEDAAWTALKQLLDGGLDVSELAFDLKDADWIKFKLKLEGKKFRQSLTASVMKGLVEYQFANYRSIALITKNKPKAGVLTDTQKDKYELTFEISGGSTETNADGKGVADLLNSQAALEAVKKMDKKHVFILVLVYLLMSYGQGIYAEHLKSVTEAQRIESADKRDARQTEAADKRDARQQETMDKIILSDKEKAKLLEKAISKNEKAGDIVEMHERAADTILKNTSDAEYVILQGRKIDREQLDQLNKQIRRRPQVIFLDSEFLVKANQPLDTGGFNITVEDTKSGNVFVAALVDPLVLEKSRKPIQDAEWNLKPVRLHVRAKDKGDGPYEAEIVKAFRQKK